MSAAPDELQSVFINQFMEHSLPDIFDRPPAGASLIEGLQHLVDQCLPGLLGLRFEKLAAEECVAELPYRKETTGIHGLMHGGTIFSAGDTITAMQTMLNGDENTKNVLTTDASIRYLRPVDSGKVRVVSNLSPSYIRTNPWSEFIP